MLVRVEFRYVNVDEPHGRILKRSFRSGSEIAITRANPNNQVGFASHNVSARRTGDSHCPKLLRMVKRQRSLTCLRLTYWNAGGTGKFRKRLGRLGIKNATPGNDQRVLRSTNPLSRLVQKTLIATCSWDHPNSFPEQFIRKIKSFRLHILRKTNSRRASVSRRSQHAHRFRKRSQQLLRTLDSVPIARNGLETIVHRNILGRWRFQLLQNWRHVPLSKNISG